MYNKTIERVGSLVLLSFFFTLAGCQKQKQSVTAGDSSVSIPVMVATAVTVCANNQCGVLDQNGIVLISPDNDYDKIASIPPTDNTFVFAKDGFWNLAKVSDKQVIRKNITDGYLGPLTKGYYAVSDGEKFSVMDEQGREVQPAKFDDLYVARETEIIIYEIDGKLGFLDAAGQLITQARFDTADTYGDMIRTGGWMTAQSGSERWIFNVNTHELKKVEFDKISKFGDGHMVVQSADGAAGLADAQGKLLTKLTYQRLGMPGNGLVAFHKESISQCGYLDFKGNIAIPATFEHCEVFGEKGALVMIKTNDSVKAKGGLIDRNGKWLTQPSYDWVDRAGLTVLGLLDDVNGYGSISKLKGFDISHGIFDVNKGVELFAPIYSKIGVLNNNLFVFSKTDTPLKHTSMLGQATQIPVLGLMDATGKTLIEPEKYVDISLDATGHYLIAMENTTALSGFALYSLAGKRLVPPKWQELVVDEARSAVFAYELTDLDTPSTLKAMFRLDGTPSFQVSRTECGAEQVRDGKGKVLWPTNPESFCPQPENEVGDNG